VRAQEPIFSLDFLNQLEIIVDIPETLMVGLQGEQELNLYAEFTAAPGRHFNLSTKEFSTRANSTTQTYQIVLVMDQPDDINILPGMTATVNGTFSLGNNTSTTLVIPAYAVFASDSGDSQVWVVDMQTMTYHLRAVQTGELIGEDNIKIQGGLEPGEVVALTGVTLLQEGMKVRDLSQVEGYGK
jgi:RND family efflux transporter MFP subunit